MSEPTIEDLVNPGYWRNTVLCASDSNVEFACVLASHNALHAVLRELDSASDRDHHFIDDLKDRIRAALGEET